MLNGAAWKSLVTTSHLAVFQRLMNSILSALIYHSASVYFDDVIINSLSCGLRIQDLHESSEKKKRERKKTQKGKIEVKSKIESVPVWRKRSVILFSFSFLT